MFSETHVPDNVAFTKMHGCGNDYIYFDCVGDKFPASAPNDYISRLAVAASDVHKGIGSDGIVLICDSDVADFRMRMFNADGTEAQMCGNASRCVGKYVYDNGLTESTRISLETLAGIKYLTLHIGSDYKVESVTVDMGMPITAPAEVPVRFDGDKMVSQPVSLHDTGETFAVTAVSMGNPHGVIVVPEITDRLVLDAGPKLEVHSVWPEKANIEFVKVIDRHTVEMRVWERGTGETWACGTGACATAVACILNGLTDNEVTVRLRGGCLHIKLDSATGRVFMTGPATTICRGSLMLKPFALTTP